MHISHAALAARDASWLAARNCMQVHGAIGYTWELDLQIWLKRVWALHQTWGESDWHRRRIAQHLFAADARLGADMTFARAMEVDG